MPRSDDPAQSGERIAKLLARAGVASRREVERMIADGRIALDGAPVATPATVLSSLAGVTLDGQPVAAAEPTRLFLFHKPVGLLVTERDPRGRPTIYDRLPPDLPRLVPVGRLDLNTEGLLLLTTDGGLKRRLELPASGVERTYRARAYGQVSQAQLESLIEGVEIEGVRYGAIDANLERRTGANVWIELTLTEGKNREVRRVLEHLGLRVGRLIRTRYGPFVLGDLPTGAIGEVRQADLETFRRTLKSGRREEIASVEFTAPRSPRSPRGSPPQPHPGEGRGPASAKSRPMAPTHVQRETGIPTGRPARAIKNGKQLDPGLYRRGAGMEPASPGVGGRADRKPQAVRSEGRDTTAARSAPKPARKASTTAGSAPKPDRNGQATADSPRPPKPQRKPGWARPKPKTGPSRPRKPRA